MFPVVPARVGFMLQVQDKLYNTVRTVEAGSWLPRSPSRTPPFGVTCVTFHPVDDALSPRFCRAGRRLELQLAARAIAQLGCA